MERERDRGRERVKLIEADIGYDSGEERRARKKGNAARVGEERKRLREKEREDDELDR